MLNRLIDWSVRNRLLVLLATAFLVGAGVWAVRTTPVDAIPDLSDVQVIVQTEWAEQAPQIIEDQVTYPLTTALLAVPGATTVRGISGFGISYVYVLFADGTDPYWARSRVLEYLSQVRGAAPAGVTPQLGPDATGVGWVYQYTLESDRHDLAELRSLQDFFVRYQLQSVPGVARSPRWAATSSSTRWSRSAAAARLRPPDPAGDRGDPHGQRRRRRARARDERPRVHGPRARLPAARWRTSRTSCCAAGHGRHAGARARRRARAARPRHPPRRGGQGRPGRRGDRHRRDAPRRERAAGHRRVKQRMEQIEAGLPEGVRIVDAYDRAPLIRAAIEQPGLHHPAGAAAHRADRLGLPAPPAQLAGGDGHAAGRGARRVPRDAADRRAGEHHVAGRHRHRHRRHGRRGRRDDRQPPQAPGARGGRATPSGAGSSCRVLEGGGAGDLLLACSSSRSASCRSSRWRRRRAGSSSRSPGPRRSPWRRPRCSPSR
jgi:hypothetical protein